MYLFMYITSDGCIDEVSMQVIVRTRGVVQAQIVFGDCGYVMIAVETFFVDICVMIADFDMLGLVVYYYVYSRYLYILVEAKIQQNPISFFIQIK